MPSGGANIGEYWLPIMPSIEGIGPEIDRKLGKAFDGVSKQASRALSEGVQDGVKAAEAAVKKSSDAIAKLRDKEADAAGKVRVAEERLAEVRDKGGSAAARAEEAHARALRQQASVLRDVESQTKSLESAQRRLESAQRDAAKGPGSSAGGWLDDIQSKAEGALSSLEGLGSGGAGAGSAFLEGFSGAVSSLGTKAGPIGLAITAAAGVALAGGKAIADQVFAGMDQQQSQANVQAKLGVDDATMKRIADAAAQSYVGNFGDSVEENMDVARAAIQNGLLDAGASTGEQSQMISQLTTVSDILGEDIPQVARAAEQALRTGLAPNATAAFDLIVKGQQAGLNASEDWLDTLNEYGTQFRKLGLDGAQATGLLSQMVKGGARDTDVAADALKEFSIRAVDGSKASVEAFTSVGLNADEMARKFLAGGDSARDAFQQTVTAINSIQDPVVRNNALLGLFGTQYEDLGNAINNVDLSTAVDQLGQVAGATQRAADVAGGTAASSWESMKRTVETAVDGMQQQLAGVFGPAVGAVAAEFTNHQAEIIGFFTKVGEVAVEFGAAGLDFAGDFTGALAGVVNAIGDTYGATTKLTAAAQRLLGNDERADQLDREADAAFGWADGLYRTSDALKGAADDALNWKGRLADAGRQAQDTATLNEALGDAVLKIPDGKTITISDNTPETVDRLRQLGIEVVQTPNGLVITATTDEAERILDSFRASQGAKPVAPPVRPDLRQADADMRAFFDRWQSALTNPSAAVPGQSSPRGPELLPGVPIAPRATGGIDEMAGAHLGGPVYPNGLVRYREPSTGGEAYIPLNGGDRSVAIWEETGRRLGVWASMAQGGMLGDAGGLLPFTQQLRALTFQTFPQIRDIGGYRSPDGYNEHSSGRALDVMIPNWQTAAGIALGDQIAQWALSIPGVNRVMWQQSTIRPDGSRSPVEDRGSPTQNHMDHVHIFTEAQPAAAVPTPSLSALNASMGASIGSTPGFGGGSGYAPAAGTPGVDPETGESGYYVPDPKQIKAAQDKVADADARVAQAEQRQRELDADAKESQKMAAQDEVDRAKREAADARAEAEEAKRGKFTKGKAADTSSSAQAGGDLDPVGGIIGQFFKDTFGLGDLFPDPSQLGIVKLANAMLGIKYTPQGKGFPWQVGYAGGNGTPWSGSPFGGQPIMTPQAASGLSFGMIAQAIPNIAGAAAPNMAPPDAPHQGTGAPPGPTQLDMSRTVNVTASPGMDEIANKVRREMSNIDRIHSYTPPGIG